MTRAIFCLCLAGFSLAAFGGDCVPSDELWSKPRSAATILADKGIRECVLPMLGKSNALLRLRHATDEDSQWRASDLRWWLIALGLEPDRVVLEPNAKATEPLVLELTETK